MRSTRSLPSEELVGYSPGHNVPHKEMQNRNMNTGNIDQNQYKTMEIHLIVVELTLHNSAQLNEEHKRRKNKNKFTELPEKFIILCALPEVFISRLPAFEITIGNIKMLTQNRV